MEYCNRCHHCLDVIDAARKSVDPNDMSSMFRGMILCPECGNKRCPHATDHRLDCTGSNESGQPGSIYAKPLTDEEFRAKFGKDRKDLTDEEWWDILIIEE